MVLIVGGISLALAVRIHRINGVVDQENTHILHVDSIYSTIRGILFEIGRMEAIGGLDRIERIRALHKQLEQQLRAFWIFHDGVRDSLTQQESALLSDLDNVAVELQALTDHAVAEFGSRQRFSQTEMDQLDRFSRQASAKTEGIMDSHRMKVNDLLRSSDRMLRAIVVLYLAFILVSGGLIILTSIGFSRGILAPLRRLSDAALGIVGKYIDKPVPPRSVDEIEQISQAFDALADRLQTHKRELQAADGLLGQKTREAQAFLQISAAISSLRELEKILQSVAEKACELLHGEAAAISLFRSGDEQLVVRATCGPPDAFRPGRPAPWSVATGDATRAHDRYCPAMQPDYLKAHLAAALRRGTSEIGVICVSRHESREFSAAEREVLTGLATQAVIAVEYARLYEEARGLATLEERDRLARELHDGLAQTLSLLYLKLTQVRGQISRGESSRVATALEEMTAMTDRAYEDLRQSMFGLRAKGPHVVGLIPGLTNCLHDFTSQSGIPVELEVVEGLSVCLSRASELQLIRIVQEALANVRKHAKAGRVWVRLRRQESWVRLSIEDDGRGFDPTILTSPEHRRFGLQTMRERAQAVGGSLNIESEFGRGTRIVASLPEGSLM